MKIDRVMLSITADPLYSEGVEYVRQAWENMGAKVTVIGVGNGVDMSLCDWRLPGCAEIPEQNFAKLIRVMAAGMYPDEYCLVSDADMLPLDAEFFIEGSDLAHPDAILMYTRELEGEDAGKFPACYMLALGRTFSKYVNPGGLPFCALAGTFKFGHMADATVLPFSDESAYRELFKDAPKLRIDRHHQERRLCRSRWEEEMARFGEGSHIDCHMPRPFSQHLDKMRPVLKSIGIEI